MPEETAPERIAIEWSTDARADIRAIERKIAMQILNRIDDYTTRRASRSRQIEYGGNVAIHASRAGSDPSQRQNQRYAPPQHRMAPYWPGRSSSAAHAPGRLVA
jgi:hypothetical protein